MTVYLKPEKTINGIVANLAGVKAEVRAHADAIAGRASALLAAHRDQGKASVEVSKATTDYRNTDMFVSLVDPAALSIEFGHDNALTGGHVEGLYIITGAAGLN